MKDKVEKKHSSSMLPKTITTTTSTNAKYFERW
jgi:hypothetical protein